MGKKKPKMEVTDYYMSVHFGIALVVDAIKAIYIGEKEAWTGSVSTETAIEIVRPDLFGGVKKEGGAVGYAYYLPGGTTQVMPDGLAARFGRTSANSPAFRGLSSIFFVGEIASRLGFKWGTNNPYIRSVWAKVTRAPKGLNAGTAMIGPDANPIHMIYECLTNGEWAMGSGSSGVNIAGFNAAAQTIFDEALGLSILWTRQSTIEAFVGEIIDHIQAVVFVEPRTGLWDITLIRDDYDENTLPIFTPDEGTLSNFQRKAWGETTNEIVVTWTNPENEQEETVTAQDLANISIQGGVISDSRNYYGVRNRDLAMKLAMRDVRTAAAPLASCDIELDRRAWDLRTGQVVKVTWPEYGMHEVVMRVGPVDYGKSGAAKIKASLTEDIFSLTTGAYTVPPGTGWVDPSEPPSPIAHTRIITLPYYFVANLAEATVTAEYPETLAGLLASQSGDDTFSYELISKESLPTGGTQWENVGTHRLIGRATLSAALTVQTTTTTNAFSGLIGGPGPTIAGFVFIGDAADDQMEIAMVRAYDAGTGWTLDRGVMDTIPRAWPIGTPVWFVDADSNFEDETVRAAGEVVEFKLLSQTSKGLLPEADAPIRTATLTARPHLPSRPANVRVNGQAIGSGDINAIGLPVVPVSWSNRNRLMEDTQVLRWADSDVAPEVDQTTTITVTTIAGVVVTTHDGLTGTTFNIPLASFGANAEAFVTVTSKRDGLQSLQGARFRVRVDNDRLLLSGDESGLILFSGDAQTGSDNEKLSGTT